MIETIIIAKSVWDLIYTYYKDKGLENIFKTAKKWYRKDPEWKKGCEIKTKKYSNEFVTSSVKLVPCLGKLRKYVHGENDPLLPENATDEQESYKLRRVEKKVQVIRIE